METPAPQVVTEVPDKRAEKGCGKFRLPAGLVIHATDRSYRVGESGAWTRLDRPEILPAKLSQIYLPRRSRPEKYARKISRSVEQLASSSGS
jgi:hypothetical protein